MSFAILPYAIHGVIFYVFSQVSHIQEPCLETTESEVERRAEYRDNYAERRQLQAGVGGPEGNASHGGSPRSDKRKGAPPEVGPRHKISAEEKTAAEHDWLDALELNNLKEETSPNQVPSLNTPRSPSSPSSTKFPKCVRQEWAVHQLRSTLDYSCESIFWSYVSNGLNNQGEP